MGVVLVDVPHHHQSKGFTSKTKNAKETKAMLGRGGHALTLEAGIELANG